MGDVAVRAEGRLPPHAIAGVLGEPALGPVATEKNAVMVRWFEEGEASAMLPVFDGLCAAKIHLN
jgi:hypothetical protein